MKIEKGHTPWNKGKRNVYSDSTIAAMSKSHKGKKYKPMSSVGKRNVSIAKTGTKHSKSTRLKMSEMRKGRVLTEEWRKNISNGRLRINPLRRLQTSANLLFRESIPYKIWRKSVFQRDGYTCVWCGKSGVRLNADHVKPFNLFPELRLEVSNGRTLCHPCHTKTDTYGYRSWKK